MLAQRSPARLGGASLVLAVLVGSLLLVACGSDSSDSRDSEVSIDSSVTSVTDGATGDAPSVTRSWRVTAGDPEAMVEVMIRRIDALGIDDAEVTVDDDTLTVVLPPEHEAELDLVGRTAALSFRPVLSIEPPAPSPAEAAPSPDRLPQRDLLTGEVVALYALGPAQLGGVAVETADASPGPQGSWMVSLVLAPGADGIDGFNALAAECFDQALTCPTGQVAIVLDDEVLSAPSIQTPSFERDQIQISGSWDEGSATALAAALSAGALPGTLEPVGG